jgi:hypothetical protein
VAELTEKHTKQIEALIKANNDVMQQLTAAINSNKITGTSTPKISPGQAAKRVSWAEKCKNATTCPHCSKIHPNRTHDQCWHLEKNAAKRPAGWSPNGNRTT